MASLSDCLTRMKDNFDAEETKMLKDRAKVALDKRIKRNPFSDIDPLAKEVELKVIEGYEKELAAEHKGVIDQIMKAIAAKSEEKASGAGPEKVVEPEVPNTAEKQQAKAEAAKKEPWQMTKEEYATTQIDGKPITVKEWQDHRRQTHEREVKMALESGKSVPPDVLKEYPNLTQTLEKTARVMDEEGRPEDKKPVMPGDVFKTATGRETTPYPKYSKKFTKRDDRLANQWLIDNAIAEAESRKDDFNLTTFKNEEAGNLPPASKDAMTMYLFGKEHPAVPRPFLKDLVEKNPRTETMSPIKLGDIKKALEKKPAVSPNKIFTEDAYLKAKKEMDSILSQLNMGADPRLLIHGATIAGYHIEKGARTFAAYSKSMVADLGEKIKPYLKMLYNAVRDNPDSESFIKEMDPYDAVSKTNIDEALKSDILKEKEQSHDDTGDGGTGPGALAGKLPKDVQPHEKERGLGEGIGSGGKADAAGDGRTDESGPERAGGVGGGEGDIHPDRPGEGVQSIDNPAPATEPRPMNRIGENPGNYHVTEADIIGRGTRGNRIDNNLAAIRLIKTLDKENRFPTREEQSILARYVGWGGLKNVFDARSSKPQDRKALEELKSLLTPDELFEARQSMQTAFYTDRNVIDSMFNILDHLGIKGGHFLEPTYGTGLFPGLMPEEMSESSKWYGSEMDPITAKIGQYLHPRAQFVNSPFQNAEFPYGKFDAAIGNPPFGDWRITDTNKQRAELNGMKIHNYVLGKSGMHVKPGGVMSFVITSRFMDTADPEARDYLAKHFKFLAAIRLPNTAFKENAGTDVVTDIVLFQKLLPGEKPDLKASWLDTKGSMKNERGEDVSLNKYFVEHPEQMIGIPSMKGTMYPGGEERPEFTLEPRKGEEIKPAINALLQGDHMKELKDVANQNAKAVAEALASSIEMNKEGVGIGGFFREGDTIGTRLDDDKYGNPVYVKLEPSSPWEWKHEPLTKIIDILKKPNLAPEDAKSIAEEVTRFANNKPNATGEALSAAKKSKFAQYLIDLSKRIQPIAKEGRSLLDKNAVIKELEKSRERYTLGSDGYSRIKGMMELRDKAYELVRAEKFDLPEMDALRKDLNKLYDKYVSKYGYINDPENASLMAEDIKIEAGLEGRYQMAISESRANTLGVKPSPSKAEKASLLVERVNFPNKEILHADSTRDGYGISLSEKGKLDIPYIAGLTNKTEAVVAKELSEHGLAYKDPVSDKWVQEDEYLSGNVKQKLKEAEATPGHEKNVEALKKVLPKDVTADEVFVDLGATWVPKETYEDFAKALGIENPKALVLQETGKVSISDDGRITENPLSISLKNDDYTLPELINAVANHKALVAYDGYGKDREINKERTKALIPIGKAISQIFKDWIFADPARSDTITKVYNDTQNTHAERKVDGSKLKTVGANPAVSLYDTQKRAAWRMIQQPVVLLDHVVGSGKTMTIITGVQERKRMGLSQKPVIVVPNHIIGQWAKAYANLYPGANILAASEKDFSAPNRKRLLARMATGKYDSIIIGHSSLSFIPLEKETQARFIREEMAHLEKALFEAEAAGDRSTIRTLTNRVEKKREKIKRLMDMPKSDVATWESMGIDHITVDESQEFKNLEYSTFMQSMAGMGNAAGSLKAFDLYAKIQHIRENNGGVAFATGTPISNSLVEMYSLLRYLNKKEMENRGLGAFDSWAKSYAGIENRIEYTATQKLKDRLVMASFNNIPELKQLYNEFADVVSRDDLKAIYKNQMEEYNKVHPNDQRLTDFPEPKIKGGQRQLDLADSLPQQKEYMDYLVGRAEILEKEKDPEYRKVDNHLWLMNDARKMALDIRLVDPKANPGDNTKVDRTAKNVKRIYDQWHKDKGTQLVFCDLSTPLAQAEKEANKFITQALKVAGLSKDSMTKRRLERMTNSEKWDYIRHQIETQIDRLSSSDVEADMKKREDLETWYHSISDEDAAALTTVDTKFSVYDELKSKLIGMGIPAGEIKFIHEANTRDRKEELFSLVNSGQVRVLIGSSKKMGAGTNVQERLVGLHHMDAPWRPSDVEQREGRIIRQGNALYERDPKGFEAEILSYSTRNTFDAVMWQILARKAEMIESLKSNKRSIEDQSSDSASYADFMAESTGSPAFKEKHKLEGDIGELESTERRILARRSSAEGTVKHAKDTIEKAENTIQDREEGLKTYQAGKDYFYDGKKYKNDIVEAQAEARKEWKAESEQYDEELKAHEEWEAAGDYKSLDEKLKWVVDNKKKAEYEATHPEPKKPKTPIGPDALSRLRKYSDTAKMASKIRDYISEAPNDSEVNFSFGETKFSITKEKSWRDEESHYTLFVDGINSYQRDAKEVPSDMLDPMLKPSNTLDVMKWRVDNAKNELSRVKKNIDTAKLTLDQVQFKDAGKLADKKLRYAEVVKEVSELEEKMALEREDKENQYIKADTARFGSDYYAQAQERKEQRANLNKQQGEADLNKPAFSKREEEKAPNGARGSISPEHAQAELGKLKLTYPGAAKFEVVQSERDLPENVIKEIVSRGDQGNIEGVFDPVSKRLFIVADKLTSADRVQTVVKHELEHKGIRTFLGDRIKSTFDEIYRDHREEVDALAKEYGLKPAQRHIAVDEFLARFGEKYQNEGAIKRVFAQLRRALRQMGFTIEWSDADLRSLAGAALREEGSAGEGIRFSRKENSDSYLKDALNIGELDESLRRISVDDKRSLDSYSRKEVVDEAKYVLSLYREPGTSHSEELSGDGGSSGSSTDAKKIQSEARANVRKLEKFIKKYDQVPEGINDFQRTQVDSKEFKEWFKGSKVVDKNETPLVVYHGTSDPAFNEFDIKKQNPESMAGEGFYFTDSKKASGEHGENVIPVYLNIRTPFDARGNAARREQLRVLSQAELKSQGYDGVIFDDKKYAGEVREFTSYVVFDPSQIKSATGNTGAFNSKSSDIRFSRISDITDKLDEARTAVSKRIGTSDALEGLKQAFIPTMRSQAHLDAANELAPHLGEHNRKIEQINAKMKEFLPTFRTNLTKGKETALPGLTPNESFMERVDKGLTQPTAELQKSADYIKKMFESVRDQIGEVNPEMVEKWRADYMPRIVERGDVDKAVAYLMSKRPLETKKTFAMQRVFDDIRALKEAGFKLLSDNPMEMVIPKAEEMLRYVAIEKYLGGLKAKGELKNIGLGRREMPVGYAEIPDKFGTIWYKSKSGQLVKSGRRVVPEAHADILTNYLSKSAYTLPYVGGLFKSHMAMAGFLNQAQLGMLSAFHAGFTSAEVTISHLANVFRDFSDMVQGKATPAELFKSVVETPFSAFMMPAKGKKIMDEWISPGAQPQFAKVAKAIELAMGRAHSNQDLMPKNYEKMLWDSANGMKLKAAARSPLAFMDWSSRFIMDTLVPRQKFAVMGELVDRIIRNNPGKSMEALTPHFREAWNRVDARLGQVNYERLFMNNVAKNTLQAFIRAPGWSGGTIAEIGGAGKDAVAAIAQWKKSGKMPQLSDRVLYTVSLLTVTAVVNGMLTKLFTGDDPDGMDFWAFRTGGKDEKGHDERFVLPTYAKDIFAYYENAGHTLLAKMHPSLSMTGEVWRNKDYYGNQIYNPEDFLVYRAADLAKYGIKQFEPFWMRGMGKEAERGGGVLETLQKEPLKIMGPEVGVMPAASAYTYSKAEKQINKIMQEKQNIGGRTAAKAEQHDLKRKLRHDFIMNNDTQAIGDAVKEGKITSKTAKEIVKSKNETPLQYSFTHLTIEEALKVYELATPKERKQIASQMSKKLRSLRNRPPEERKAILEQYKSLTSGLTSDEE